jgi:hypothetical protein
MTFHPLEFDSGEPFLFSPDINTDDRERQDSSKHASEIAINRTVGQERKIGVFKEAKKQVAEVKIYWRYCYLVLWTPLRK